MGFVVDSESIIFGLARNGKKLLRSNFLGGTNVFLVSSGVYSRNNTGGGGVGGDSGSGDGGGEYGMFKRFGVKLGEIHFIFRGISPGINAETGLPLDPTEYTLVDTYAALPVNLEEFIEDAAKVSFDKEYTTVSRGERPDGDGWILLPSSSISESSYFRWVPHYGDVKLSDVTERSDSGYVYKQPYIYNERDPNSPIKTRTYTLTFGTGSFTETMEDADGSTTSTTSYTECIFVDGFPEFKFDTQQSATGIYYNGNY